MIHYHITCPNPESQFIHIQLELENQELDPLKLQLPSWRAGRYQLANYAQNIRGFKVFDTAGNLIPFQKKSKDLWQIIGSGKLLVNYEYWAGKMDAGSAWVDDEQVYFNLVNCCFEVLGQSSEEILVTLELPEFPDQISTLIPVSKSSWKAADFQMLADSTILASKKLIHWNYRAGDSDFHIWIQGEVHFEKGKFISAFEAFSKKLIQDFGEFPEPEYHFIFQLLPYPHYHGVEHRRGTVITFGPAEKLAEPEEMEELLGVSCHELYHAWNVCRIRPKELLPYDFSKETYTEAGLILEGVTTYLGDMYLLKSGVYKLETYLKHLAKVIQREADNFGWKNYSILESSFDLWLDGYVPGIPDRKVNIYTRGAILAMGLDAILINSRSSLRVVMRRMWERFGKPNLGYTFSDFQEIIAEEAGSRKLIEDFFERFVSGHKDYFGEFKRLLNSLGIQWNEDFDQNPLLHEFGVRINELKQITQIHPESDAYKKLMKGDVILEENIEEEKKAALKINRMGRVISVNLDSSKGLFFPKISLSCPQILESTKNWMS
ncbi:putative metalloprotease with PDZ domain [Algoriphagus boseongensis]|uniref:Putative metalloprotease with PDZ domain n=1 Tax=Algoriphagus boseongensis TaxID=1442587 RepID=A0A4R6T576_9BACT|nr:M61 family metallopeptidase [Algoriphagus boseongensis]TDQ17661.1 putative metalloprotease with PDZ domain [Algoriphagus boseongensis]